MENSKIATKARKKRCENWSPEERSILRRLVEEKAAIIESKKNCSATNYAKVKEWQALTQRFNNITGRKRDVSELKLAWKRTKLIAKAKSSGYGNKTGEGKPPQTPPAFAIVNYTPLDFIMESTHFDSDAMPQPFADTEESSTQFQSTTTVESQIYSDSDTDVEPPSSIHFDQTIDPTPTITVKNNQTTDDNDMTSIHQEPNTETGQTRKSTSRSRRRIYNQSCQERIAEANINYKEKLMKLEQEKHAADMEIKRLTIEKLKLEIEKLTKDSS